MLRMICCTCRTTKTGKDARFVYSAPSNTSGGFFWHEKGFKEPGRLPCIEESLAGA